MIKKKYSFLILVMCLYFSCRVQKVSSDFNICDLREKKVLKSCLENNLIYSTIKIQKIDINYSDGSKKTSMNGWMRMVKDSSIVISINPGLGIEIGRIYVFPDSAFYMDRINKKIWIVKKNIIEQKYFDTYNIGCLQDILVGNIQEFFSAKEYNWTNECDKESKIFIISKYNGTFSIKNYIDNSFKNIRFEMEESAKMIFISSDYRYDREGLIDKSKWIINLKGLNSTVEIEYGKKIIDDKIDISFEMPSKYETIYVE